MFFASNTKITPNFLVWNFLGNVYFPLSFGRFVWNSAETVHFPQSFFTRKLDEITVIYAVIPTYLSDF